MTGEDREGGKFEAILIIFLYFDLSTNKENIITITTFDFSIELTGRKLSLQIMALLTQFMNLDFETLHPQPSYTGFGYP
ncbi:MAG: hypothetical protein AAF915_24375 [Cyanobacteria bacterium P01_D01_bin.50]